MSWEPDSEEIRLRKQDETVNKIREEQFFINTNVDVGDTTSNAGTVNGLSGFNFGSKGDFVQDVQNAVVSGFSGLGVLITGAIMFITRASSGEPTASTSTITFLNGGGFNNAGTVGQVITLKPVSGETMVLIDTDPTANASTVGNLILNGANITIGDKELITFRFQDDVKFTDGIGGWIVDSTGGGSSSSTNAIKTQVRATTTANNLTHPLLYSKVQDGVTLFAGDRFLVKNQTTQADNGIYTVGGIVANLFTATRATDFDNDSDVKAGVLVAVEEGTIGLDSVWLLTTNFPYSAGIRQPIVVGTTAITWTQIQGSDNLGNHVATQALKMDDNAIFFDIGLVGSILYLNNTLVYTMDVAGGEHSFFTDNLSTPRFVITDTAIQTNVPLDMNLNHIVFQDIAQPSAPSGVEKRFLFSDTTNSDRLSVRTPSGVVDLETGTSFIGFQADADLDMDVFDIKSTHDPAVGPNTFKIIFDGHLDSDTLIRNSNTRADTIEFFSDGNIKVAITPTGIEMNHTLDFIGANNITSSFTPTSSDQFRIVFDGHDDSDTHITNSTLTDVILFVSNGVPIFQIDPNGLTMGDRIDANGHPIEDIDYADFGTGSAGAGEIRLKNADTIQWEASPAGTNGIFSFNSGEQFTFSRPVNMQSSAIFFDGAPQLASILYLSDTIVYTMDKTGGEHSFFTDNLGTPRFVITDTSIESNVSLGMNDQAIFFDQGLLGSILFLSNTINYTMDHASGAHDFYCDDIVTPRFGINNTSLQSNVNLDMNLNYIIFQDIAQPSAPSGVEKRFLFSDTTNSDHLSVRTPSGVVDLETGGDNLGNHIATQALEMDDNAIFFDIANDSSILYLNDTIIYTVDINGGEHSFFIDDLGTPKVVFTETAIQSNVDLDMNVNHIVFQDISQPSAPSGVEKRFLFSDTTNSDHLSVRTPSGVVDLEASGSGDNLGNHTATTTLNMNGQDITGLDDITFGSGATITNDNNKLEFQVPTGDYWMFKIGTGNKFYISETLFRIYTELDMNYQKIIKVGNPLASSSTFANDVPNMGSLTGSSPAYTMHTGHLGSGTASSTTFLRGDSSWATVSATVDQTANYTWTGDHLFRDATSSGTPVKFQGNNVNTAQTVAEMGSYGTHSVKFIAEITGQGSATISDPDGNGTITIPNSDPSISIKAGIVMNTYSMYDLDTLVFSQHPSSTTPAPENDWVWIEANTGTGSSPSMNGMHYNVPSGKTHQFKINGTEELRIGSNGITFSTNSSNSSNGSLWYDGSNLKARTSSGGLFTIGSGGGSSGADTSLSNLSSVSINADLDPSSDNARDLGNSSVQWRNIYIDGTAYLDAIGFGSYSMALPTSRGSNGQVLTTNGSSSLSWTTVSGGGGSGADTDLNNLTTTSINKTLTPASDDTYSLGTSSKQWDNLYVDGTAYIDTLSLDGGSNGYVLSTNGSGSLSWVAQSGGGSGASTSLNNLTTTSINKTLTPSSDDTYSLGTSSKQWDNLYVDGIAYIDTLSLDGGSSGQVLSTNGSGSLSWVNQSGGGGIGLGDNNDWTGWNKFEGLVQIGNADTDQCNIYSDMNWTLNWDTNTGGGSRFGRIKIKVNGTTKYIHTYNS